MQKDEKKRAVVVALFAGAGAGKTMVLEMIRACCSCLVLQADTIAHSLYEQGETLYRELVALFGEEILDGEGTIDRRKLASLLFGNAEKMEQVNALIHPPVWQTINRRVKEEIYSYELILVEAALLPAKPLDICDEIWYIHTGEALRRERLVKTRGYSQNRIDAVFSRQPSEETYRLWATRVIENEEDEVSLRERIAKILVELGIKAAPQNGI